MRGIAAGVALVIGIALISVAPAAAAPAALPDTATYRVEPGDTLWRLSRRFGTTPEHLAALNEMSLEDRLQVGQVLKVPAAPAVSSTPSSTTSRPSSAGARRASTRVTIYRVQAGDTLWSIARRHGTRPEPLAALNRIPVDGTLRIGQALKVPAPAGIAAPASAAPSAESLAVARARLAKMPSRGVQWMSTVVALSKRYLGVRYRWGGATPAGFDCSGFLGYVFARTGVQLPRTTFEMFRVGTPVPRDLLQTGDIVFFETVSPGPSHAGVYLGDGRFAHSSSGIGRVSVTPMDHRYYAARYLGARRF